MALAFKKSSFVLENHWPWPMPWTLKCRPGTQQQQQQYLFGKEQPGCQKGHRPIKTGHPKVK